MARVCQHAASPNSAACCSRHRVRCRASILHNPQQRVSPQQQGPIQLLRDWITANGGYIHPALQLVDNARVSGCRGIIAAQAITLDELEWGPLISVPQSLQLTSRHALELIGSLSNSKDIVSAVQQQLTDGQLVAAALAYHCKQLQQETSSLPQVPSYSSSCSSSFWWPYISNLPPRPQNPWLVQNPDQIAAAIRPYASSRGTAAVAGWAKAVADYRQQMLDSAAAVEQLLGGLLAVTVDDMMTATGHLQSRSLTSSGSSGLVPFVDLLNHGAKARAPMLQLDDNDKLVVTVLPIYNDEVVPLAVGDELLISYQGGYTPLEAFLKFGFVADEWWT